MKTYLVRFLCANCNVRGIIKVGEDKLLDNYSNRPCTNCGELSFNGVVSEYKNRPIHHAMDIIQK